jgi:acyl-CoA thioesterase
MQMPESYQSSAFNNLLGAELVSLANGQSEVLLRMRPELGNRGGKLHGGAIFTLVDIAMGLACSDSHGFEQHSVTLEVKINYLRAVSAGDVFCRAKVIHAGRRTLVLEADVLQGEQLVAKAQGTFAMIIARPGQA